MVSGGGVNIMITDRSRFQPVYTGLEIAVELHRLFPADWKVDGYSHLLVNSEALERLKRGDSAEEIRQSWNTSLERFRRVRDSILIYK